MSKSERYFRGDVLFQSLPQVDVGGPQIDEGANGGKPHLHIPVLEKFYDALDDEVMRVHHETRELPVYNLVVAKGGLKDEELLNQ